MEGLALFLMLLEDCLKIPKISHVFLFTFYGKCSLSAGIFASSAAFTPLCWAPGVVGKPLAIPSMKKNTR